MKAAHGPMFAHGSKIVDLKLYCFWDAFFKVYFNTNLGKVNNPSLGSTFSTNLPSIPYFLNDLIFPWIKREVGWY